MLNQPKTQSFRFSAKALLALFKIAPKSYLCHLMGRVGAFAYQNQDRGELPVMDDELLFSMVQKSDSELVRTILHPQFSSPSYSVCYGFEDILFEVLSSQFVRNPERCWSSLESEFRVRDSKETLRVNYTPEAQARYGEKCKKFASVLRHYLLREHMLQVLIDVYGDEPIFSGTFTVKQKTEKELHVIFEK